MLKLNVSRETVGRIIKGVSNVAVFAAMIGLPNLVKRDAKEMMPVNKIVEYDDVIGAIMNSSMLGSDKVKAANIVKHANRDIHRAAIQVIESNLLSSDKLKVIERIYSE